MSLEGPGIHAPRVNLRRLIFGLLGPLGKTEAVFFYCLTRPGQALRLEFAQKSMKQLHGGMYTVVVWLDCADFSQLVWHDA